MRALAGIAVAVLVVGGLFYSEARIRLKRPLTGEEIRKEFFGWWHTP